MVNELKEHVDRLFHKYGKADHLEELKAEILSNLEAKQADLVRSGVDEASALKQTKESMTSEGHLIDGNKKIYIHPYRLELLQYAEMDMKFRIQSPSKWGNCRNVSSIPSHF